MCYGLTRLCYKATSSFTESEDHLLQLQEPPTFESMKNSTVIASNEKGLFINFNCMVRDSLLKFLSLTQNNMRRIPVF